MTGRPAPIIGPIPAGPKAPPSEPGNAKTPFDETRQRDWVQESPTDVALEHTEPSKESS